MKRFLLSILALALSSSGFAQIVPDSTTCFVDLYVTNQGNTYSVEAIAGGDDLAMMFDYTWTFNGIADTSNAGNIYTFTGVDGMMYDICVSIPCDTLTVDMCTSIYVDSIGITPIDSILPDSSNYGCLTGITTSGQNGYLTAFADFGGSLFVPEDLTWSVNGVTDTTQTTYFYSQMAAGTYYVCATYDNDSCTVTFCDSVEVLDPWNPIDSLDYGCLLGINTSGQNGYLYAYGDFGGLLYESDDLTWSVDGVTDTNQTDYFFAQMAAGTYYVCATYTNDSCTVTFCDTVVVTDPINPIDSLDSGCLTGITANGFGGQYFFSADFDNPTGIISDVVWTIDSVVVQGVNGGFLSYVFAADGDYTICATYDTDSCFNEVCIDITVDNTIIGNDSIIFIDSIGFGDWVFNDWDSVYVDSNLLDELDDWDFDDWSDSLLDIFFGDSLNIDDLDSNDIYVLLDGLTQDQIDSLLNSGIVGLDLGDLDEYWDDFLDDNDGIDTLGLTLNDLIGMFADYIEAKATELLGVQEVTYSNIDVFFNRQTGVVTIDSDQVGRINVYNIQGQRVLTQNDNNPQLNLSSINTGLYILSIEINGKVYSHKIVK